MERNESVLLHIRSVRVNWKSNRTTGGKTGKQSCVGWQCHFKCWYQNQILGIIWHIIAKCLKHILKIGMAEWLMCLTGGGNYDCVKRFMILKMLKCFGHSLQKQWLFLGNRKASFCSHGNRLEGAQGGLVQSSSAQAPSSLRLPGAEAVGTFMCSDPAADKEEWTGIVWYCSCSLSKTD